jgi:hypothetical protein
MNKMLINHLDKIFVTSDTATLLKELEVVHPAAKIMVMAAAMQESEIGDGSNLVIVLIGELLAQAGQSSTRRPLSSCFAHTAALATTRASLCSSLCRLSGCIFLCQLRNMRCRGVEAPTLLSLLSFAQVD